jgi:hypothetical protein
MSPIPARNDLLLNLFQLWDDQHDYSIFGFLEEALSLFRSLFEHTPEANDWRK